MQPFCVAAFLFFTMAISVYDHQDENNEATDHQHDEDRTMLPKFRHQGAEI